MYPTLNRNIFIVPCTYVHTDKLIPLYFLGQRLTLQERKYTEILNLGTKLLVVKEHLVWINVNSLYHACIF